MGGQFWPENLLRRGELAAIAVRSLGYREAAFLAGNASAYFDVAPDSWVAGYATVSRNLDLVRGWETSQGRVFEPETLATVDQVVTVLVRALGYETLDMRGSWPQAYRSQAVAIGLCDEETVAQGDLVPTRGQVAVMVARALTRVETSTGTYLADRLYQYGEASSGRKTCCEEGSWRP